MNKEMERKRCNVLSSHPSLDPLFLWSFCGSPQIMAEEINDNRVANFEVEARKLDNKVQTIVTFWKWQQLLLVHFEIVQNWKNMQFLPRDFQCHFNLFLVFLFFLGFLWKVWPLLGVLQADRNWVAASSQDRGIQILLLALVYSAVVFWPNTFFV